MAAEPKPQPLLAEEPGEVPLAGNAPLPLDSAGDVWLVDEGMAEVFAVPQGESGPRIHLCTVSTGSLLFGFDPPQDNGHGLGLLAVGAPGTRLRRLPASRLQDLVEGLDAWLAGLCGGLARPVAPRVFEELRPGAETHLEQAGRPARAREGVA